MKVTVLAGDGVGPEITSAALKVLHAIAPKCVTEEALIGGAAYRAVGHPLPEETLESARKSDAILFGAVGDFDLDHLPRHLRPEQAILGLRKEFDLFSNLRPAKIFPALIENSAIKPEIIGELDLLIIRELTGDIYFGQPRGCGIKESGEKEAFDTMHYSENEVRRVAHVAFAAASRRAKKLCSIDKANVLETMQFWRNIVIDVGRQYPEVSLSHLYVDNAAMQLVSHPQQFDVMLAPNMFGDILSDQAAALTGSIGLLPSASLNGEGFGLYEPIHGSAPDIAGQNKANPVAMILSVAMMLEHSFSMKEEATRITQAVSQSISEGYRTADILSNHAQKSIGTKEMASAILHRLSK